MGGWKLSPAYDINPIHDGEGLKLNISEHDNSQEFENIYSVIGYFRLDKKIADEIFKQVLGAVSKWRERAMT